MPRKLVQSSGKLLQQGFKFKAPQISCETFMACDSSLYVILQVPQQATVDEIKLAFKRRALQVHPDKGGSKDAFHTVYQALEILSDPEARKKYDQRLMGAKEPQS